MTAIRLRLIGVASALLACQVAVMVAAPVLLYQAPAAAGELLCECKVEPGAECPMHGGKAHDGEARGKKAARFSPVCGDQTAAVLTLLASGSGILEPVSYLVRPATSPVAVLVVADSILDSARPPTSPPPRS